MSESTSSMSDSTSHDNGESTVYKLSFNNCLCLWWTCCSSIFMMSLAGAVVGRQAAELAQRICITFKIHHSHLAGGRLICTSGV